MDYRAENVISVWPLPRRNVVVRQFAVSTGSSFANRDCVLNLLIDGCFKCQVTGWLTISKNVYRHKRPKFHELTVQAIQISLSLSDSSLMITKVISRQMRMCVITNN